MNRKLSAIEKTLGAGLANTFLELNTLMECLGDLRRDQLRLLNESKATAVDKLTKEALSRSIAQVEAAHELLGKVEENIEATLKVGVGC